MLVWGLRDLLCIAGDARCIPVVERVKETVGDGLGDLLALAEFVWATCVSSRKMKPPATLSVEYPVQSSPLSLQRPHAGRERSH